ncbi:LCP family protein [Nocardioides cheoyonin]|uniref:LCP family protein n=1 Tax=Nocardioides cheoyonin TaxID=3156615 RepID=UPI0032B4D707
MSERQRASLRSRLRRMVGHRLATSMALGAVLAVAALVVPDSSVAPTNAALVKLDEASGVDLGGLARKNGVIWILAVGSDARPGQDMLHTRGDALQLIGINTRTGAASSIGVPRDSWVDIPGHGYNKINSSLYFGGPKLLGQTVGNLVGIQPSYVFVTKFPYLENMVNGIGGITVQNPVAFSDEYLKPKGFKKGRIHLDGYDAMAFSRIRHDLLRGDFDRSANQQRVLRGIQLKVRAHQHDVGFLARGVVSVMKNLHTNLSPGDLYKLAQAVARVDPTKIRTCVVQGSIGDIGGASVVLPFVSAARAMGADARADATLSRCR